jgi:hypothetical protein
VTGVYNQNMGVNSKMENIPAKREIVIESGPIGRPYAKIIL